MGTGSALAHLDGYTVRDPRAEGVAGGGRRPWAWAGGLAAKRPAIAGYRTQVDALFPGRQIPLRPETYYAPASRVTAAPSVAGGRRPSTAPAGRAPTAP